ncbi:T9SS type A sorting domain-containing protein [Hymenobacter sp. J193]|uniref:T9SS type A sorting domain-containing protein n=1 Tax=Hymenobacter sp. J193 TaxID=2898429 RepID=UPI0021511F8F|nr:T9SS type A sorting domain-containing protein [Hymenobacter sp. J193]MCR5886759.1 T9SS type A sorting domain-containing protein [Hymenobacter sp. J193]
MKKLSTTLVLGLFTLLHAGSAYAQLPTDSYAVTRGCNVGTTTGSTLQSINVDGSLTPIGPVYVEGTTTPLILNALGYDEDNEAVVYAMDVPEQVTISNFATPPSLYRIDLGTAEATNLGSVTPPPAPPSGTSGLNPAFRVTLNFIGDGEEDADPVSLYYVGGISFRYNFLGVPGARINDFHFYVGTVQLNQAGTFNAAPTWRELDISDPATTLVINGYKAQVETYLAAGATGPAPEGGIQDWVYDPASGNLVSYLGKEDKFLTIVNPATAPVASTVVVANPVPTNENVGGMFRDNLNQVYTIDADNGLIHRIDRETGEYTGESFGAAFGCSRGDAMSFAGALPLPVTLTRFDVRPEGARVAVEWTTASEQLAKEFRVERSADGHHWITLHEEPATNTAQLRQYQFTDAAPAPGLSYYRLAMQDLDGTLKHSEIRQVTRTAGAAYLRAYPVPAHDKLTVEMNAAPSGPLTLTNSLGQVVRRQVAATATTQLSTAGLPAGVYFLNAQTGSQTTTQRVLIR